MVVSLLHKMQALYNCFTLSLSGSDSRRSIRLAKLQRCYDGDQGVAPVTMVIMTVLWRWRSKAQDDDGHIMSHIIIACDVYLLYILFFLVRRQLYKIISH